MAKSKVSIKRIIQGESGLASGLITRESAHTLCEMLPTNTTFGIKDDKL